MKRAALYSRVSSEEQVLHGLSLDAQLETLKKYAVDNEYIIADIYTDEGITARKRYTKRPEFVRLLDDAKAGNIDVILFCKLDRWFRNISDYYEVQKILDAHGVQWIATEEDYNTTTTNGRLLLNLKLTIAQNEADTTSDRIKFVFEGKRQRGEVTCGAAPFGYKIENKHLVPDENAQLAVEMFNQFVQTRSIRATSLWCYERNIGADYTTVRRRLQNTAYIGSMYGNDNFCQPIIDKDIFEATQSLLLSRSPRNTSTSNRVYLFSGLLRCSECGAAMHSDTGKGKAYYRCRQNENYHSCSNNHRVREDFIETWLLQNLAIELDNYNIQATLEAKKRSSHTDEAKIRKKMTKLKELYLDDKIDRDEYDRDYAQLKALLDAENKQPQLSPLTLPDNWKQAYELLDRSHKKAFWNRILLKIENSPNSELKITFR